MDGTTDRGQAERTGRATADSIAPEKRDSVVPEHVVQAPYETFAPLAEHEAEEHAERFGAFRSEIGEIGGDQFPGDVGPVGAGQEMHAFDQHVVGEDERFAADFEHGRIVRQPARGRMMRERPQAVDEGGLRRDRGAAQRTALATASSTPLTNFASRSSKKACATSTYSLIAVPVGTSARARSS